MSLLPELAAAIAGVPMPPAPPEDVPIHLATREKMKVMLSGYKAYYASRLPPADAYTVTEKELPVEGGQITVRCLIPARQSACPVLLWMFGGGFFAGTIDDDDNHLRGICVDLQLAVVLIGYRLAPEHPFPAPFEDCYSATKWVAENAEALGVSIAKGFIVGGDSAGGNLSAAIALKARDDAFFAGRQITGQYLREPAVAHPKAWPEGLRPSPSSLDLEKNMLLSDGDIVLQSFTVYGGPPTDTRISPLLAASHANLPPAFLQVMEIDQVRDDGVVYERLLREAGVKTKMNLYEGMMHGAHDIFPALEISRKIMGEDIREGLKWLLDQTA